MTKDQLELRKTRRALFMCACSFQGGHSDVGATIAIALGVSFPLSMKNLVEKSRREGFDPNDLWPWLRPMVEARGEKL